MEEEQVERLNKIQQLRGKAFVHSALSCRLGAISKRIPWLLSLMFGSLPCFAAGQTMEAYAADSHPEPATLPLTVLPAKGLSPLAEESESDRDSKVQKVIVIGFVGGFARGSDQKHPEVQFAELLRERYGSGIFAAVYANHDGGEALNTVLGLLGSRGRDATSSIAKDTPRILLYGHSWGAAEVVIFARELGKMGIPVFLTIQVDSIAKPGHDDARIPANVAKAINLYQSRGPLHGRTEIFAAEPARTTIIGNLHMTYERRTINCDNYPWFARTFNKPHHEIENDPRVWDLATSLIASAFDTSSR